MVGTILGKRRSVSVICLCTGGRTVRRKEDGSSKIEITYRFGPPESGERDTEDMFVGGTHNALS
jgi:hypothetical protein